MNCTRVERLLTEDIESAGRADVRAHLRGCPGCAGLLEDLLSIEQLSASLRRRVRAPGDFADRVALRLDRTPPRAGLFRAVAAVTAALVLAGVGLWAGTTSGGDSAAGEPALHGLMEREAAVPAFRAGEQPQAGPVNYVDIVLDDAAEPEYILRLPARIQVQRSGLHSEAYLRQVSH